MDLVGDQQGLETVEMAIEINAIPDSLVLQRLEGDGGISQQLLGVLDVVEDLGDQHRSGVLDGVEVRPQAILLVLLAEPLEIRQPWMYSH